MDLSSFCLMSALQTDRCSLTKPYAELMHTAVDMQLKLVLRSNLLHDRESEPCAHAVAAGFIALDKRLAEPLRIFDLLLCNIIDDT